LGVKGTLQNETAKLWKYDWHDGVSKGGGHSYVEMYHRVKIDAPWQHVGGFGIDCLITRGGLQYFNITFHALGYKQTYALQDLQYIFSKGALVRLFEKWYWRCGHRGGQASGTLYDGNSKVLATMTAQGYDKTNLTIYGDGSQSWQYRWKRGQDPDVDMACVWALADEFGCSVSWVISVLAGELGPLEWLAIGATTLSLFAAAYRVTEACAH
jgi:hypothetical protein